MAYQRNAGKQALNSIYSYYSMPNLIYGLLRPGDFLTEVSITVKSVSGLSYYTFKGPLNKEMEKPLVKPSKNNKVLDHAPRRKVPKLLLFQTISFR